MLPFQSSVYVIDVSDVAMCMQAVRSSHTGAEAGVMRWRLASNVPESRSSTSTLGADTTG